MLRGLLSSPLEISWANEANFLVLTGNPLVDFKNVKTIEMRIKRGELLQP